MPERGGSSVLRRAGGEEDGSWLAGAGVRSQGLAFAFPFPPIISQLTKSIAR